MAGTATQPAKAATKKKAAPKKPAPMKMVTVAAIQLKNLTPVKGTYHRRNDDLRAGMAFRTAEDEITVRFECGETVSFFLSRLEELCSLARSVPFNADVEKNIESMLESY